MGPSLFNSDSQLSYYHDEDEFDTTNDYKKDQFPPYVNQSKNVRFSEFSTLKYIPSNESYSEQEREAMYLTTEDKERIREEINDTLTKIQYGDLPDTELEYFRGLEWKGISYLYNQKKAIREITLSLILSEQEQMNEICPDWIENVYSTMTKDSVAKARKMARWDAQCVDMSAQ